ncbi:MAG: serine hydrolase [Candidatus Binataceae bacterium]
MRIPPGFKMPSAWIVTVVLEASLLIALRTADAQPANPSTPAMQDPQPIVEQMVNAYMQRTGTHAVAVSLRFGGRDYLLSFGDDGGFPAHQVTPDLLFGIGSVTKVFTATMLAAQTIGVDGNPPLKRIDDCVCNYLPPEVAANGSGINQVTLRELATQTSGMPNEAPREPGKWLFHDRRPPPYLIRWWENYQKPEQPGWLYSNAGFITLGFALEGPNSWPRYNEMLAAYITSPLGMSHTFALVPWDLPMAQGYDSGRLARHRASDLKSSARDMLVWLKANLGLMDQSIPPQLAQAIRMTHQIWYRTSPNLRFDMGLAWQVQDKNPSQPRLFSKNGGVSGFTCWVGFMPDLGIGLSILTNESGPGFDEFFAPEGPGPRNATALGIRMIRRLAGGTE